MDKTYHLDFETLLKTLSNGTFEITTSLTVSNMPATGLIALNNGQITTYYIQLHDGRRIDGDQVFRLLMKQARWHVQPIQSAMSAYQAQPVQPMQPTPSTLPLRQTQSKLPPLQPPQHRHTVPLLPMSSDPTRPTRKPVVSGSGQGPSQTPQSTMPTRKPVISGSGQGPSQTPSQPITRSSVSSPSTQPPTTQPSIEQTPPTTHPAYTPPVLPYPTPTPQPPSNTYREPTQPLPPERTSTTWTYATGSFAGPQTDALPPANIRTHRWRQKSALNLDHIAHLSPRERLVLRTVLAMINGQRDAQAIQEYLTLQPEVIDEALNTLSELGVIE